MNAAPLHRYRYLLYYCTVITAMSRDVSKRDRSTPPSPRAPCSPDDPNLGSYLCPSRVAVIHTAQSPAQR